MLPRDVPRPPCPAVDARPGFILPWRWIYRQAHCTIRKSTGAANCLCSSPSATIVAILVSEKRPETVSQFAVASFTEAAGLRPRCTASAVSSSITDWEGVIESGGTPAPFDPASRIAHPTASGPAVRANGICSTALTDRACGRTYCARGVYHCL